MKKLAAILIIASGLGLACVQPEAVKVNAPIASPSHATSQAADATVQSRGKDNRVVTVPITLDGSGWPLVAAIASGVVAYFYFNNKKREDRVQRWEAMAAGPAVTPPSKGKPCKK